MKPAIKIRNLGKEYTIASPQRYLSFRDIIAGSVKKNFQPSKKSKVKFWALQDINIDIMPGERVGIIGRNGAGKSTLLKIISRITPPTTGEVIINGRVGCLLEVGTGFHPELSGRENIYLNGSILGLKRSEIYRQLDEIIDFSGVEKFIDTPLKHYSSGMQLRLAFSIAAHLEPEILLIDEVLAVGDIEFQKKCLGKMEEVSKNDGRTILFVSHDLSAIGTLTNKSLFIEQGKIKDFGNTNNILIEYSNSLKNTSTYYNKSDNPSPSIESVEIKCSETDSIHAFGKLFSVNFGVNMPKAETKNMALSFQIINAKTNIPVLHYHIFDIENPSFRKIGLNKLEFFSERFNLYKGNYFLRVFLAESKTKIEFERIDCCNFQIEMIGVKEIEWGWSDNMCQYLEEGKWVIK